MSGDVRFVDVGELQIRVSERSRRAWPLPLVPGTGTSLEIWPPLLDPLGDLRTLAFDPPRHGSVRRLDVLGVSWGGALAQQIAHQAPRLVRRLVLVATSCGLGAISGHPLALVAMANPLRFHSRSFFELVAPHVYGGASRSCKCSDEARTLAAPAAEPARLRLLRQAGRLVEPALAALAAAADGVGGGDPSIPWHARRSPAKPPAEAGQPRHGELSADDRRFIRR